MQASGLKAVIFGSTGAVGQVFLFKYEDTGYGIISIKQMVTSFMCGKKTTIRLG